MGDSSQAGASANASATTEQPGPNYGGMALALGAGITKGYAARKAGIYNRKQADFNARELEVEAEQSVQAGDLAANRVAGQAEQVKGAVIAGQAGQGVVAGAGSGAAVLASTDAAAGMDETMIRMNAMRQAYGYRARAVGAREEGRMADMAGRMAVAEQSIDTATDLLKQSDANYGSFTGRKSLTFDTGES